MSEFTKQLPFEIARRIELRGPEGYTWLVVTLAASEPAAVEDFILEIAAALSVPFRVVNVQGLSLEDLRDALHQPAIDGIVLTGFHVFDPTTWGAWDINRSSFQRPGPIVLWLSPAELAQFCNLAPNLRSFVGGSIFGLSSSGEQLTEGERLQRIQELEAHYNASSGDIIKRARAGLLPPEPHFVEWLVLLGRGDLV